jgi:hypothetical protein
MLFEAERRESSASGRIESYSSLLQDALSSISSRQSSLLAAAPPTLAEEFITRYTTGLDLDYSDAENATLSNMRVSERLRELAGLERIVETNTQGVEALTATKIAVARTDLSDQLTRIREAATAEETAQDLRRRLLGTFQERLGALGALQAGRIGTLLRDIEDRPASSGSSLNADTQGKRNTSFKV